MNLLIFIQVLGYIFKLRSAKFHSNSNSLLILLFNFQIFPTFCLVQEQGNFSKFDLIFLIHLFVKLFAIYNFVNLEGLLTPPFLFELKFINNHL